VIQGVLFCAGFGADKVAVGVYLNH